MSIMEPASPVNPHVLLVMALLLLTAPLVHPPLISSFLPHLALPHVPLMSIFIQISASVSYYSFSLACPQTCLTCSGSQCTSCPASTPILHNAQCTTSCPNGYFGSNNICELCVSPCLTCSSTNSSCISCITGYFLNPDTSECLTSCPSGYFSRGNICMKCDSSCNECTEQGPNRCISCGSSLRFYEPLSMSCHYRCPSAFYIHEFTCVKCHELCLTCSGPTAQDCESCMENALFLPARNECMNTCPFNYFILDQICACKLESLLVCSSSCGACFGKNSNNCLSCPPGKLLLTNRFMCVSSCPLKYFQYGPYCVPCHSSCVTCYGQSSNNCLSCDTNYHYISALKICSPTCPDGYYENNGKCEECDASCSTCSQSSKICSTCPETRYLNSTTTTCTSSCSSGFAPSFENVCEPCNERCLTCKPKYLNYCLTCAPGLTIQGGTCVASCESGFTFLGDSCVCKPIQSLACPLNCMSCNGPNSDQCTACWPFMALVSSIRGGSCAWDCPQGTYLSSGECLSCSPSCKTCTNSPSKCSSCDFSLSLAPSTSSCLSACPEGFFSFNNTCTHCDSSCSACSGSSLNCLTCPTNQLYIPHFSSCTSSCPTGFFQSPYSTCVQCADSCAGCDSYPSCSSCPSSFSLTPLNQCLSLCPSGFYSDSGVCQGKLFSILQNANFLVPLANLQHSALLAFLISSSSLPSQLALLTVRLATTLSLETANLVILIVCTVKGLFPQTVLSAMILQFFTRINVSLLRVLLPSIQQTINAIVSFSSTLACHQDCNTCFGPQPRNCESCTTQQVLYLNQCLNECPPGTFQSSQHECILCDSSCLFCSGPSSSDCLSCPQSLTLLNTSCITGHCPDGYLLSNQVCLECHASCAQCTQIGQNGCISCISSFFFHSSSQMCLNPCPPGFYGHNGLCKACQVQHCSSCNLAQECQTCLAPFALDSITLACVAACPLGYFLSSGTCQKCSETCSTCENHVTHCLSCEAPLFFHPNLFSCLSECPDGYYASGANCNACPESCEICSNSSNCTLCQADFYLSQGQCVGSCIAGSFQFERMCISCDPLCSECTGNTPFQCSSCAQNALKIQDKSECVSQCPQGYYKDQSYCRCNFVNKLACPETCSSCTNSSNCISCARGYLLEIGKCFKCPNYRSELTVEALMVLFSSRCSSILQFDLQAHYILRNSLSPLYSSSLQRNSFAAEHQLLLQFSHELLLSLAVPSFRSQVHNILLMKLPLPDTNLIILSNKPQIILHLSSTLRSQISSNSTLLISVWKQSLFTSDSYKDSHFQAPAFDIIILDEHYLQLDETLITIEIEIDSQQSLGPLEGAAWNQSQWNSQGISVHLKPAILLLESTHLSTFTLIHSPNGISRQTQDYSQIFKWFGVIFLTIELFLLSVALIFDLGTCRASSFPHRRALRSQYISSAKKASLVLKYSVLYNFPLISIFSFRDYTILSFYRALWFTNVSNCSFALCMAAIYYHFYYQTRIYLSCICLSILIGLCSLLHSSVSSLCRKFSRRERTAKIAPQSMSTRYLRSSSTSQSDVINLDIHDARRSPVRILLFCLFFLVSHSLFWFFYFSLKTLHLSYLPLRLLFTTALFSFLFGIVYCLMKVYIATRIALDFRVVYRQKSNARRQNYRVRLFVDEMTSMLHQDFANFNEIQMKKVFPENVEEVQKKELIALAKDLETEQEKQDSELSPQTPVAADSDNILKSPDKDEMSFEEIEPGIRNSRRAQTRQASRAYEDLESRTPRESRQLHRPYFLRRVQSQF